jgi:hypothetical protein
MEKNKNSFEVTQVSINRLDSFESESTKRILRLLRIKLNYVCHVTRDTIQTNI